MNDKNKEFLTPLHLAVDKSHYDVIDVLLKCRAKVNALDSAGQTALHRAARDGNVQACRMLLAAGADATIVSLQGATAAQLSTESVSKLLSEEPSSQAGADLEYQLLEAAKAGDLELVKKVVVEHPQIGTITLPKQSPLPKKSSVSLTKFCVFSFQSIVVIWMADIPHLFTLLQVTIELVSLNFFFNMEPMFMPKTKAD